MSGTPSKMTGESAKIAAGINATALFFAPLMVTSPFKGRLPLMTIFFIEFHLYSFLIYVYHSNFSTDYTKKKDAVYFISQNKKTNFLVF